jgi:hypothetical protein
LRVRRVTVCAQLAACILSISLSAQPNRAPADLAAALERIGAHVEQYYTRARSIVCVETVRLQPLSSNFMPDGFGRRLVYELRVAWEPPADGDGPHEATVLRQIVSVDGRPPRAKDDGGCMDPKPVSPEPLAFLLPGRRSNFIFTWVGAGRVDGREGIMLDYKSANALPADIAWHDECVSVDLPGQTRGRVWIDAATDDVLRLDERLSGPFEFRVPREHTRHGDPTWMTIERADSSIRYRPVVFHDPEETVMLPASIESLTVIRNSGTPRLRTTQEFSNYRRFMTGGRLVR